MITVDSLSKTCPIPYRTKGDDHFRTVREAVMDAATAPWRRLRPTEATSEDGPATSGISGPSRTSRSRSSRER